MTNPRRYIGDSTTNSWGGPAPGVPRDYNFSIYIINNFCEISKKIWLLYALVLRACLRINYKTMGEFLQEIVFQDVELVLGLLAITYMQVYTERKNNKAENNAKFTSCKENRH